MSKADDRAWERYTASFREAILPHLLESVCMISVQDRWTPESIDLRAATELGLMLMLDKPLLLVIPPGEQPPAALRRAAREIVWDYDPTDEAAQARVIDAVTRLKEGV